MSRIVSRAALLALLAALVAAVPLAATADAKPKPKCQRGVKRGNKNCPKAVGPSTKVTVDLLEGSQATVDVPAVPLPGGIVLPGMPVTRTIPISGRLTGVIPGGYLLGKTNAINLKTAAITPAPVDILSDGACGGAAVLKLDPASTVGLNPASPSGAKIFTDGRVTGAVNVGLKLAFDSRTEAGCDKPLVAMGSSTTPLGLSLSGKVQGTTGLNALTLDSAPVPYTVLVCLAPGTPGTACATPPVGYPVTISVHAVVKVAVGT